ncbi:SusD/RagB family nutrient-binding outer membrane lipoprotein [Empedobacter falsenii]|uniref:SusD/RagB family nutrient-binding outer membrane lipoprotein n=1 Tax=Empedobacter falsenii TaxID=343874 RepID=UPI00257571BB|nr:SusD/RagB family nutrient-binding outer membrane lipoprotein [Empedobacter falsenii]MDM1546552.1 SusD/RagB family nutrient-binding outer membrane lipoprotein [Empedobacter falsenii]
MKKIKILLIALSLGFTTVGLTSCDTDFEEINSNPNNPEEVPVGTLFNGANRYLIENLRDGWWHARFSLPWMQYSAQNVYIDEDKYAYRDADQAQSGWADLYRSAANYQQIIKYATDKDYLVRYGYADGDNTVATARIMLAYTFDNLVTHFGDVPYWSFGSQDADFQALQIEKFKTPVYASQEKIYKDLLKELKEAEAQLSSSKTDIQGDLIYGGNIDAWKKFANSLRLRIANRVKAKLPEAQGHITDAIAKGVFTSNDDNAQLVFEASSVNGNPFWKMFYAGTPRVDFFPNKTFVELLKGDTGSFKKVDPRLFKFVAPTGLTWLEFNTDKYSGIGDVTKYIGLPYGIPDNMKDKVEDFTKFNFFSRDVLTNTRPEVLMEFSEVSFLLSENNNWNQADYIKGIEASMNKWGVSSADIATYVAGLPAANQENVLTQKYIALFMQADEAWNEYRRTGYPNTSVLLLPGEQGTMLDGTKYTFQPMVSGNVVAKDIPGRVRYPSIQQTLNGVNRLAAANKLSNKDEIDSKLFFAK